MDPQAILDAAGQLSIPALVLVVMGGVIFAGIKVVGWGEQVTKLLGNHLRHDLADVKEEMRGVKHATEAQTLVLAEQTAVLKAVGRRINDTLLLIESRAPQTPPVTVSIPITAAQERSPTDA